MRAADALYNRPMKRYAVLALIGMGAACTDGPHGQTIGSTQTSGTGPPATPLGTCEHQGGSVAFEACSLADPCACPLECLADPAFASPVCEMPCADPCPGTFRLPGTSSTLPTASACVNAFCRLDACAFDPGGAAVSGSYGGLCTAVTANDGTCFPTGVQLSDGGAALWGVCLKGNLDGVCGAGANPSCVPGSFCIAGGCQTACDPTLASTCAGGVSCQAFPGDINPHAGYCGPPCSLDGEVCSGSCCNPASTCGSSGVCERAD
jgi:hypothetical protein